MASLRDVLSQRRRVMAEREIEQQRTTEAEIEQAAYEERQKQLKAQAEEEARVAKERAKAEVTAAREAEKQARAEHNNKLEADFKGSGRPFYVDAGGYIRPSTTDEVWKETVAAKAAKAAGKVKAAEDKTARGERGREIALTQAQMDAEKEQRGQAVAARRLALEAKKVAAVRAAKDARDRQKQYDDGEGDLAEHERVLPGLKEQARKLEAEARAEEDALLKQEMETQQWAAGTAAQRAALAQEKIGLPGLDAQAIAAGRGVPRGREGLVGATGTVALREELSGLPVAQGREVLGRRVEDFTTRKQAWEERSAAMQAEQERMASRKAEVEAENARLLSLPHTAADVAEDGWHVDLVPQWNALVSAWEAMRAAAGPVLEQHAAEGDALNAELMDLQDGEAALVEKQTADQVAQREAWKQERAKVYQSLNGIPGGKLGDELKAVDEAVEKHRGGDDEGLQAWAQKERERIAKAAGEQEHGAAQAVQAAYAAANARRNGPNDLADLLWRTEDENGISAVDFDGQFAEAADGLAQALKLGTGLEGRRKAKALIKDASLADWSAGDTEEPARVDSRGNVLVNPSLWTDEKAYMAAVEGAKAASEAGKKQALEQFPAVKDRALEAELGTLRTLGVFADWEATGENAALPDEEKLAKFRKENSGVFNSGAWKTRLHQALLGVAQGVGGIAQSALGVADAVTRSETTRGALETVGKEQGKLAQGSAALPTGQWVNFGASMAVSSAPALVLGGTLGALTRSEAAALKTAAGAAGLQSAGGMYAQAMDGLKARGFTEAEAHREALMPALAAGLTTYVLTAAGGTSGVEAVLRQESTKKALGQWLATVGKGALKEGGLEEAPDQLVQGMIERLSVDPGKPFGEIAKETLMALVGGAVMGAGFEAASTPLRKNAVAEGTASGPLTVVDGGSKAPEAATGASVPTKQGVQNGEEIRDPVSSTGGPGQDAPGNTGGVSEQSGQADGAKREGDGGTVAADIDQRGVPSGDAGLVSREPKRVAAEAAIESFAEEGVSPAAVEATRAKARVLLKISEGAGMADLTDEELREVGLNRDGSVGHYEMVPVDKKDPARGKERVWVKGARKDGFQPVTVEGDNGAFVITQRQIDNLKKRLPAVAAMIGQSEVERRRAVAGTGKEDLQVDETKTVAAPEGQTVVDGGLPEREATGTVALQAEPLDFVAEERAQQVAFELSKRGLSDEEALAVATEIVRKQGVVGDTYLAQMVDAGFDAAMKDAGYVRDTAGKGMRWVKKGQFKAETKAEKPAVRPAEKVGDDLKSQKPATGAGKSARAPVETRAPRPKLIEREDWRREKQRALERVVKAINRRRDEALKNEGLSTAKKSAAQVRANEEMREFLARINRIEEMVDEQYGDLFEDVLLKQETGSGGAQALPLEFDERGRAVKVALVLDLGAYLDVGPRTEAGLNKMLDEELQHRADLMVMSRGEAIEMARAIHGARPGVFNVAWQRYFAVPIDESAKAGLKPGQEGYFPPLPPKELSDAEAFMLYFEASRMVRQGNLTSENVELPAVGTLRKIGLWLSRYINFLKREMGRLPKSILEEWQTRLSQAEAVLRNLEKRVISEDRKRLDEAEPPASKRATVEEELGAAADEAMDEEEKALAKGAGGALTVVDGGLPAAEPKVKKAGEDVRSPAPAKPKKAKKVALWDLLQAFFEPGAVVPGYGKTWEKVIKLEDSGGAGDSWRVQVQEVNAMGEPVKGTAPRWHSTLPSEGAMRNAWEQKQESGLASAVKRGKDGASMASDSPGAAQNAEPSPGGLSEAEESIKRGLPSDLASEYGKLGKDVAVLWRGEQTFPEVSDVKIIGGDSSGKSVSSYPTAAVYLDNGGVFLKRFRVSNHDQVSQTAYRQYDLDYRLTRQSGESEASFDERTLAKAEQDLVNAARLEWEQQMEQLRPLTDASYAAQLAARKAAESAASSARIVKDTVARFFKDKSALPAKRYTNDYGLVFQDGRLSDSNDQTLGTFSNLDEARYWARDNWTPPNPESSRAEGGTLGSAMKRLWTADTKRVQDAAIDGIFASLYGTKPDTSPSSRDAGNHGRGLGVRAAAWLAREVHGAGQGQTQGVGGGAEALERVRREQSAVLADWARENGLLLTKLPAEYQPGNENDVGAMEHHAWETPGGERFVKLTKAGNFGLWPVAHGAVWDMRAGEGTPLRYLERLNQANGAMGDDWVLHGVLVNRQGKVQILTSQPNYTGVLPDDRANEAPEEEEQAERERQMKAIGTAMASEGFQRVGQLWQNTYYRPADNTAVFDAHLRNVMWVPAADGGEVLVPFDVTVMKPAGRLRENLERAVSGQALGAAVKRRSFGAELAGAAEAARGLVRPAAKTAAGAGALTAETLREGYERARVGQSSVMLPLKRVYESVRMRTPGLSVEDFLRSIERMNEAGEVLLGGVETTQALEKARPFVVGANGTELALPERGDALGSAAKRGGETAAPREVEPGFYSQLEQVVAPKRAVTEQAGRTVPRAPVDVAAHEAATSPRNDLAEPSEAQKRAGNYQHGHIRGGGHEISIENPAGSRRRPEWPPLKDHYGYFAGTNAKDGDAVDVFVKPGTDEDYDGPVHVVRQVKVEGGKATKAFDEYKVMLGYPTAAEARAGYLRNYEKDWPGLERMTTHSAEEFKRIKETLFTVKRAEVPGVRVADSVLASAAKRGKDGASMASDSPGAAQNAEPSPGGLSEAEAREKGFTFGPWWHGNPGSFFDYSRIGLKNGTSTGLQFGFGFYFGPRMMAAGYGKPKQFMLRLESPLGWNKPVDENSITQIADNLPQNNRSTFLQVAAQPSFGHEKGGFGRDVFRALEAVSPDFRREEREDGYAEGSLVQKWATDVLIASGFDGVDATSDKFPESSEVVIFSSSQAVPINPESSRAGGGTLGSAGKRVAEAVFKKVPVAVAAGLASAGSAVVETAGVQRALAKAGSNNFDKWIAKKVMKPVVWDRVDSAKGAVSTWLNKPEGLSKVGKAVMDQAVPLWNVPREWLALYHESQRKAAWGREKAMDVIRALSHEAKVSDLAYPKEFVEDPQWRSRMFDAMEGRAPMADLPKPLQDLAGRLRKLLEETGREMVKQGVMNLDTFNELSADGWMPRYTEDEAEAAGGSWLKAFKLGLKDLRQQRSTAWHIVDTTRKDATGQYVTVNREEGGKKNRWRFRTEQQRNGWYEDFVKREGVRFLQDGGKEVTDLLAALGRDEKISVREEIRGLTAAKVDLPATLSPALRGIVKRAVELQRFRYKKEAPFEPEKLIKDPVYAVARYVMAQTHNAATMELLKETGKVKAWVSDVAVSGFTEIPDNPRFGPLAKKFVRDDIAQQVLAQVGVDGAAMQWYDNRLRQWKAGKLVLNPGSHVRDAVGNTVFAFLGGSSIWNPGNLPYYRDAIRALRDGGEAYAELIEQQVLGGDAFSTQVQAGLKGLLPDSKTVEKMDAGALDRIISGLGAGIRGSYNYLSELRKVPDDLYKTAAYLKYKDMGMTPAAAAAEVRKWFPYYDRLGQSGFWKHTSRIAMPFSSFFRESTRILLRAAIERPLALATALSFAAAVTRLSVMMLGLGDDDEEAVQRAMRGKLKGGVLPGTSIFSMLLPTRTDEGQLQQWDISAVMPFADLLGTKVEMREGEDEWTKLFRAAFTGSPILSAAWGWSTNTDAFSGRRIVEEDMGVLESTKERLKDLAGDLLPPLTPWVGVHANTIANAGRRMSTLETRNKWQSYIRAIVGLDVRSADPNLKKETEHIQKENKLPLAPAGSSFATPLKSRLGREIKGELIQDEPDVEVIAEALARLEESGNPVRSPKQMTDLLDSLDPTRIIKKEWRARLIQSFSPEAKRVWETSREEFRKAQGRATPALIEARKRRTYGAGTGGTPVARAE